MAEAEAVAADARAGGSGSSRYLAWWVLCGAGWVAGTFGLFAGIEALAWPGIVAHVVALGALMGDGSDAASGGRRSGL